MKEKNNLVSGAFFLILMIVQSTIGRAAGITIAGVDIYLELPMSMAIAGLGVIVFLISPRFARAELLIKHLGILLIPVLFPVLWSHIIWIVEKAGFTEIRRGYASVLYLLFDFCAAAVLVYVFGKWALWLYLFSLLFANAVLIVRSVLYYGHIAFLKDFLLLLTSFAGTTGTIMSSLEIHGITYALGIYIIYFLVSAKDDRKGAFPMAVLTVFCFLTGLKRAAVLALFAAVILGYLFRFLSRYPDVKRFMLRILGIAFLAGVLVYVGSIYFGIFEFLEKIGIDTNRRAEIYHGYRQYFEFSPAFLGKGTGWVDDLFQRLSYRENLRNWTFFAYTHNDFLKMFIELGMFGSLFWCCLKCNLQVSYAYRHLTEKGGDLCLALTAYMAVTYMVDSTSTQPYMNMAFAVIVMSHGLSQREEAKAKELEERNRRLSEEY